MTVTLRILLSLQFIWKFSYCVKRFFIRYYVHEVLPHIQNMWVANNNKQTASYHAKFMCSQYKYKHTYV